MNLAVLKVPSVCYMLYPTIQWLEISVANSEGLGITLGVFGQKGGAARAAEIVLCPESATALDLAFALERSVSVACLSSLERNVTQCYEYRKSYANHSSISSRPQI